MKVVLEDVAAQVYNIDGQLIDVKLTIEIDTELVNDMARQAYWSRTGISNWANKAVRAFVQDEGEASGG